MTTITIPGTARIHRRAMSPEFVFPVSGGTKRARKRSLRFRSTGLTDIGLHRTHNQDCFALDDELHLYSVADGMGGGPRGDLASHLAVSATHELMGRRWSRLEPQFSLQRAIYSAWLQVCDATLSTPELSGMGTTIASLFLEEEGRATIAHVGDSRIYRLRGEELHGLTTDHTLVAELVADGILTSEEAAIHPRRNVLSRAICLDGRCEVEVSTANVEVGDVFLLCSDGLNSMLGDEEIQFCLEAGGDLESTCTRLVHAALRRGGKDNVTVVLVEALEAN